MVSLILDPDLEAELIAERQRCGGDRFDEVWDEVYIIAPVADNEHQQLITGLATICYLVVDAPNLGAVFPGVNVSDREDDWTRNYRCPDVAVYLLDNPAEDRGTHWLGGPDFAVEIVSPGDRSREKLPFYAKVGTRELLVIDRSPWSLELFRLRGETLESVGTSTADDSNPLASAVLPLSFRLMPGEPRPRIEVARVEEGAPWLI